MEMTGNDHTTRRRTNLLQDGIGRHFGIGRWELGAGPVRCPLNTADVVVSAIPFRRTSPDRSRDQTNSRLLFQLLRRHRYG